MTHYIGSKTSIISKAEIRYEGVLYQVDTKEATITLAKGKRVNIFLYKFNRPQFYGLTVALVNFCLPEHNLYPSPSLPPFLSLSFTVRSFGTEDRPALRAIPPKNETYEFIIFRGSDIKDLVVSEMPKTSTEEDAAPQDPAILSAVSTITG